MSSSVDVRGDGGTARSSTRVQCAGAPARELLAELLTDVLGVEDVADDSHFFDDLGADSLVMARFCARVRKQPGLRSVSMKDIYRNPTVSSLAASLDLDTTPDRAAPPATIAPIQRGGHVMYVLCGTLQLAAFLCYACLGTQALVLGYGWISGGRDLLDVYVRSMLFGDGMFLAACVLPVAAKWLLIGRWRPQRIRIWSLRYFRFWMVKTLIRSNPLVLFAGTPLYIIYLRALGARIGPGVNILSRTVPVCTDLLTIGEGTVIRKDAMFSGYRAHNGMIETGSVTLGTDAFVGEQTVLDINTALGDGAQLGHSSSLHAGQAVPDGQRWHGSPAQPTGVDCLRVAPAACGTVRRATFVLLRLLTALGLMLPLAFGGLDLLLVEAPRLTAGPGAGTTVASWTWYGGALAVSSAAVVGSVLLGLLVVATVPRLLNLAITPEVTYPLYGFHYWVHRTISTITNVRFFGPQLFGDSSYIVHYLRWLGYDLSTAQQTGSNFGTEVKHESPYLCSVGAGTMIADGLSIMNAEFSSTSFRVSRATIGPRSFLGNFVGFPSGARVGDNCLLATKVMVPMDGPVREGVGLLGSPSFEIPRSVERDGTFDDLKSGDGFRRRLSGKNRHNIVTMCLYLLARVMYVFGLLLIASWGPEIHAPVGILSIALANLAGVVFSIAYFVLVDRIVTASHPVTPLFCSIYDVRFWRRERFWKVPAASYLRALDGTPFKGMVWRLLGARVGRRLFDDGCYLSERTLVRIGDDCTLNALSKIQCHSQEDGAFKSDRSAVGSGCTLGAGAVVHYGATMGDGAALAPGAFLMKGEEVPEHARWAGNPARDMR